MLTLYWLHEGKLYGQWHWEFYCGTGSQRISFNLEVCILRLTFIPKTVWFWGYCIRTSHYQSGYFCSSSTWCLFSHAVCLNSVKNWQLWIILKVVRLPPHSSLSSSSPLVPLLQRWKQWTVDARKKLAMMAATETEMPEKMMMKKSVRVRVIWHSRKLSWESWLRGTRRPSVGKEHSIPSIPVQEAQKHHTVFSYYYIGFTLMVRSMYMVSIKQTVMFFF